MSRRLRVKLDKMRDNGASLCQGCLSSDRVLYSIGKYDELNQIIIDNSLFNSKAVVLLCWECATVLNKMKLFKEQVRHAANILTLQRKNLIITVPKSLSKLSKCHIKTETVLVFENETELNREFGENKDIITLEPMDCTSIDNKKELNLVEPNTFATKDLIIHTFGPDTLTDNDKMVSSENLVLAVKEEIDDDDDYDGFVAEDFEFLAPLKVEPEIRKEKDNKKTDKHSTRFDKYMWVENYTKELIFKDKINVNDISMYMKMERDSKFFVRANFKCEKCLFKFKTEEALEKHNLTEHDLSLPYKCEHCQTSFASDTELQDHGKKHLICYRCRACTFECYTYSSMKAHVRMHKGCIQCKNCGAFERNVREFYTHYKKWHKLFCCESCGKKYSKKESIQKHIIYHHQKIACDVCGLKVKPSRLADHKRAVHTVARTELSYCVACNKQYDNEHKLQAHFKQIHNQGVKKEFKCPMCEKIYSRRSYMINHYRLEHEKKTNNYCVDCDKYYLNGWRYRQHRAYTHEGKRPLKNKLCSICGRGFSTNTILIKHIRTHTGERPYKCTECEAAFSQKVAMTTHRRCVHKIGKNEPFSAQYVV